MKSNNQIKRIAFVLLGVAGLALPVVAGTNAPASPRPLGLFSKDDDALINGRVTAKTVSTLTVGDKVITITDSTSFLKEGSKIKIDDIQVGDTVKVTTTKGDAGALQAVTVVVTATDKSGN